MRIGVLGTNTHMQALSNVRVSKCACFPASLRYYRSTQVSSRGIPVLFLDLVTEKCLLKQQIVLEAG